MRCCERGDLGVGFREAVDGGNVGWLNANCESWWDRRDLLDDVIGKGADVAVWFIQNVGMQNGVHLLHSLIREKGMIDDVLEEIEYDDDDLCYLTDYRPELAGSPEKFFRILDKIKEPKMQEMLFVRVS